MKAVISLFIMLMFCLKVHTFTLDDKLQDESMEQRASDLFKIIKCPICSGETLSESAAYDMRKAIRKKISDGYTDQEIIVELKHSYGNSIIVIPPVKYSTYILWYIPLIALFIGCFLIYLAMRNQS